MGDVEGQGSVVEIVIFLDENHCRNPHLLAAISDADVTCEKHLDHFPAGAEDVDWLPVVAARGWSLLTTDARIRTNYLERKCVEQSGLRMFYFSRNDIAGVQMGIALRKAIPAMKQLVIRQPPPFTASITRNGEVTLRDKFGRT